MDVTAYDRARLAEVVGAVSLGGHALPAGALALDSLGMPMEAGGLVLGPLLGLPALFAALLLVLGAGLLVAHRPGEVAYGGLVVTLAYDVLALVLFGGPAPLLVLGAAASATSLGLFLSLLRIDTGGRDRVTLALTVAGFLFAAFTVVVLTAAFS